MLIYSQSGDPQGSARSQAQTSADRLPDLAALPGAIGATRSTPSIKYLWIAGSNSQTNRRFRDRLKPLPGAPLGAKETAVSQGIHSTVGADHYTI